MANNNEEQTEGTNSVSDMVKQQILDYVYAACRKDWDWMPPYPKEEWTTSKLIEAFSKPPLPDSEDEWELTQEMYHAVFHMHVRHFRDDAPYWLNHAGAFFPSYDSLFGKMLDKLFPKGQDIFKDGRMTRGTVREELLYRAIGRVYTTWRSDKPYEYMEGREAQLASEEDFLEGCFEELIRAKISGQNVLTDTMEYIQERRREIIGEVAALNDFSLGGWEHYYDEQIDLLREWLVHKGLSATPDDLRNIDSFVFLGTTFENFKLKMRTDPLYDGTKHYWIT